MHHAVLVFDVSAFLSSLYNIALLFIPPVNRGRRLISIGHDRRVRWSLAVGPPREKWWHEQLYGPRHRQVRIYYYICAIYVQPLCVHIYCNSHTRSPPSTLKRYTHTHPLNRQTHTHTHTHKQTHKHP